VNVPLMASVTDLLGSSRLVIVIESPGALKSMRPSGSSIAPTLPPTWICTGKSHTPSTLKSKSNGVGMAPGCWAPADPEERTRTPAWASARFRFREAGVLVEARETLASDDLRKRDRGRAETLASASNQQRCCL
jgi:hypothetical protein